jgi:hypothetical protein
MLEEEYKDGKNKFFAHKLFETVIETAWDKKKKGQETPFTKMVNTQTSRKVGKTHWILIAVNKVKREIKFYDSLGNKSKYNFDMILLLVNKMKKK